MRTCLLWKTFEFWRKSPDSDSDSNSAPAERERPVEEEEEEVDEVGKRNRLVSGPKISVVAADLPLQADKLFEASVKAVD